MAIRRDQAGARRRFADYRFCRSAGGPEITNAGITIRFAQFL